MNDDMQHLYDMIGVEQPLTAISRGLKQYARGFRAPIVGAMHVTCSDESERECVDVFQDSFVQEMLPELKFHSHSAFRTANLGGRYEWGAVRIAEQHFATPDTQGAFKVLVRPMITVSCRPCCPLMAPCAGAWPAQRRCRMVRTWDFS